MALTLKPIGALYPSLEAPDDWIVLDDGREVGRILKDSSTHLERWIWTNKVLPNTGHDRGLSHTFDEAKAAFRARWDALGGPHKMTARK